ncbi:MAG TPA: hypothetical protein VD866_06035 [Urbifossiella sp.]|nr:hypothetical protein [Urbifossiella sp.]
MRRAWVVVALALAAGCTGPSGSSPTATGPTGKQALDDLAAMLKQVAADGKRPPARPADLEPYDAAFLSASLGITRKEIVYRWGAGLTGGPAVVAYETAVPEKGGWVLLQDGTVKELTAGEFASAPKAGKQ